MVLGLVLAGCSPPSHETPRTSTATPGRDDAAGLVLPDVTLAALDGGKSLRLAGLRGTPTVINLWASWCAPCRTELPLLARAHREYGGRVRVVGIDFADDAPDAARDIAKRAGVGYPLVADPGSSVKPGFRVVGLPQTVFVDAQGTIVATGRRAYRSYDELTTAIARHLGVKP
jgi:thiol-disulfide isomerase/thioredoxin